MEKSHKIAILLIVCVAIIAGAVRYVSAFDNLWLDEIWSVNIAKSMHSPLDAFRIAKDNNHILNTVYLYYFGEGSRWPQYRLLSIIAGIFSVALIGIIGFRRNIFTGIASLIFGAFSLPLITYSSEARGYSLAVFFSLAAFSVFQKYGEKTHYRYLLIFWLSVIGGFLSHIMFFYIYGAFIISSFSNISINIADIKKWKYFMFWHAVPLTFCVYFYSVFVKNMEYGGGDFVRPGLERFSLFMVPALSLPYGNIFSLLTAIMVFTAMAVWICLIERRRNKQWLFYLTVSVALPITLFSTPMPFFSPRYLVFSIPFIYLCISSMLSELAARGKIRMAAVAFVLLGFVLLSAIGIHKQIESGRGNYLKALSYIRDKTAGSDITVGSDHDFRNQTIMKFYEKFLKPGTKIYYFPSGETSQNPEWIITHNFDLNHMPPQNISRINNQIYDFQCSFRHSNILSGWSWFIYRRR